MFKRLFVAAAMLLTSLAGAVAIATHTASPAAALCIADPIEGDWHNINASASSMARAIVETCQSVTTCSGGTCTTVHDAATFARPFGKCHPTNCDWGRRQAQHMADNWIRTVHAFGFKTSYVWMKTYVYYGQTYLRVWVHNDFTPSDGRADYTTDDWFLK